MTTVAPREIADLVYRASRVVGADSGVASMIGRAAAFAQVQTGGGLDRVCTMLAAGDVPPLGFVHLAKLEMAANVETGGEVTVADLAAPALDLGGRGIVVTMVLADGRALTPHAWLSNGSADLLVKQLVAAPGALDQGVVSRVAERSATAAHDGVDVDTSTWAALTELAHAYLVPEAIIDAAT